MNIVLGLIRADDLRGWRMQGCELADGGWLTAFRDGGIGPEQQRAYGWPAPYGLP